VVDGRRQRPLDPLGIADASPAVDAAGLKRRLRSSTAGPRTSVRSLR
jgi:hypothetical protein